MKLIENITIIQGFMKVFCTAILIFLCGCSMVEPGERGVRVWFGHISSEPQPPGVYLWVPVVGQINKIDVQVQKSDVETTAQSKDLQPISVKVAINWSLAADHVVEIYNTLGNEDDIYARIISPAVSEVFKASLAQFTAEQLLQNRLLLKKSVDDGLRSRLSSYGVNTTDVSILDLHFTDEFMNAVEKKQVAEQQSMQAKYVADKAIQDAQAEINHAKGQAEAQRLLQTSLTPAMLQKLYLEKWDGHLPQVAGSQNPLMGFSLK